MYAGPAGRAQYPLTLLGRTWLHRLFRNSLCLLGRAFQHGPRLTVVRVHGRFGPSSEPDKCQSVHDSAASGELDGSEPASHKAIVRTVSQQGADGPVKSAEVSRQGSLTPPVTAEQHLKLPSTDFFRTRKISKAPQLTVHAYSDWQGASLPVTTPRRKNTVTTPKQGSRRASLDELPGFGSWAQRQFRFQPQSAFATEEAEVERPSTPTLGTSHRGNTCNTMRTSETDDEDAARQAAWRWRFNRRYACILCECSVLKTMLDLVNARVT